MKINWRYEWPMWFLILAMFALGASSWNLVPERLPIHWNAAGQANGWGGRGMALFCVPAIATFVYLMMLIAPRLDPGRANYEAFAGPFRVLRFAFLLFLTGVDAAMIATYRGVHVDMIRVILPLVGGLFLVVSWLMTRLQPNWLIGIRTPWTLSSREAWIRAHRLGSRLFLVNALLFILAGVIGAPWALYAALGLMLAGVLAIIAYSYLVWRDDPHKVPPAPGARG